MASLREMQLSDVLEVATIEKEIFEDDAWSEQMLKEELADNPFGHYYVLVEKEKIVGYCGYMVMYENAEILTIGVLSNYRRSGFGTMMMDLMLNEAKAADTLGMSLEVRVSNQAALALYHRYGFKIVATRKNYYQNGEDAYLMFKKWEESK